MALDNSIGAPLSIARKDLLELSLRNRLLNTPRKRSRSKSIEIVDERSDEIFRILVTLSRSMRFLPMPEPEPTPDTEDDTEAFSGLSQPDDDDENGTPARHTDNKLQTTLTSEGLQKRLMTTYYETRAFQEEQGVNIRYLVLGFLQGFESESS